MRTKEAIISNSKSNSYNIVRLAIIAGALIGLVAVTEGLKRITVLSEWVTRYISRYIVWLMGHLTFVLPFSVFELLAIAAIIAIVVFVIRSIIRLVRKEYNKALKGACLALIIIFGILNFYNLTAGFAYYREELPLPMSDTLYKDQEVAMVADYFVKDYVDINSRVERDDQGDVIAPYSHQELLNRIRKEFDRLDYGGYYSKFSPMPKGILNSWFMSDTGITGIAFLPTGEPNYNRYTPKSFLPQVIAHEIAHTKGVMKESDANLVSYYLLISSQDEYLRYCGYFSIINTMRTAVIIGNNFDVERAAEVFSQVPQEIIDEQNRAYKYWSDYQGPISFLSDILDKAGEFFNDLYLKINGAKDGTGSYDNPWDVIDTGDIDPDTQQPIYKPVYSRIHKVFFAVYESMI